MIFLHRSSPLFYPRWLMVCRLYQTQSNRCRGPRVPFLLSPLGGCWLHVVAMIVVAVNLDLCSLISRYCHMHDLCSFYTVIVIDLAGCLDPQPYPSILWYVAQMMFKLALFTWIWYMMVYILDDLFTWAVMFLLMFDGRSFHISIFLSNV